MKKLLLGLALSVFTLSACINNNNKSSSANNLSDNSALDTPRVSPFTSPVNGILKIYLQMKNDFANPNALHLLGHDLSENISLFRANFLKTIDGSQKDSFIFKK